MSINLSLVSYKHRSGTPEEMHVYSLASLRLAGSILGVSDVLVKILSLSLVEDEKKLIDEILYYKPDIIGLSAYNWTIDKTKKIATHISLMRPDIKIVIGGPETQDIVPSDRPEEILFVMGEGESVLKEICTMVAENKDISSKAIEAKGLLNVFSTQQKPYISMNTIGKYEGELLYSDKMIDSLTVDLDKSFTYFETTRGCYFKCGYCGHKGNNMPYKMDLIRVEEELKNIVKLGFKEIYVTDPILGADKSYSKQILKLFQKYLKNQIITFFHRPEFIDDETIELVKGLNMKEFRLGIQTLNPDVPKWVRNNNIQILDQQIPKISKNGIPWRADLIIGLPGDTLEGLKQTIRKVIDNYNPNIITAFPLTVLKGTLMYTLNDKNKKYRLISNDNGVICESNSFSPEELADMIFYATVVCSLYTKLKKDGTDVNFEKVDNLMQYYKHKFSPEQITIINAGDYKSTEKFWNEIVI